MKKKYKLIKKYPGSPKLGTTVKYIYVGMNDRNVYGGENGGLYNGEYVENQPEFWEEIIDKNYEVLSYKGALSEDIYTFASTGNYKDMKNNKADILSFPNNYNIHSIKRLSDGEVFTVGDRIGNNTQEGVILRLRVTNDNRFQFSCSEKDGWCEFEGYNKIKQPLFKTEDGVEIFVNDIFWYVGDTFNVCETKCLWNFSRLKTFSTKEAAEEYVKMNKPEFSRKQVVELLSSLGRVVNTVSIRYNLTKKENGNN